jgi:hypothetical protein
LIGRGDQAAPRNLCCPLSGFLPGRTGATLPGTADKVGGHPVCDVQRPDPGVWDDPAMRTALATHDFGTVYWLLIKQSGYTQAKIGKLVGHRQPYISETINGRSVLGFALLHRITHGLGIPPGYVGLACCPCPHNPGPSPEVRS